MKNKMTDLNDHLFAQLERLNDDDLKGEELTQEVNRAKSIADLGKEIVANYRVQLDAFKLLSENGYVEPEIGKQILGIENKK